MKGYFVGRFGLEPKSNGLKVRCSTIELTSRTSFACRPEPAFVWSSWCVLSCTRVESNHLPEATVLQTAFEYPSIFLVHVCFVESEGIEPHGRTH